MPENSRFSQYAGLEQSSTLFSVLSATQPSKIEISLLVVVRSAAASSGPTCRARKPGSPERSMATAELRAIAVTPVMASTVSLLGSRLVIGSGVVSLPSAAWPRSVSGAR